MRNAVLKTADVSERPSCGLWLINKLCRKQSDYHGQLIKESKGIAMLGGDSERS